jgi:tetratricopeptide (TPR) repeat protein/transcriptional regulator with XRE-family HTH domain
MKHAYNQPPAFSVLLRRARLAAGLTQEALAEQATLSVRAITDLERGVNRSPHRETLRLLVTALHLSDQEAATFVAAARPLRRPSVTQERAAPTTSPRRPLPLPLVGRTAELALLDRHLGLQTSAAEHTVPLLLLAGAPGIGKTRLLHAALPRAVAEGWCVLEGGCQRRGGEVPFGDPYAPLLGALQRYLGHRTPAQLRTELAGCAWLVRLLPELAAGPIEPLPAWTLPPAQERRLMVEAVVRVLSNVAGPAGTLLVLDDLQWAGADALALLMALVRAAAEVPLRVIGAYRDTEVRLGEPFGVLLGDLAQAELAVHHTLGALTHAEAGQLLAGLLAEGAAADVDPVLLRQVVERTGGLPFFLVSYARALQAGLGTAVPWDLAMTLRQRVAALPEAAQEVLGVAAVIGRVVPRRLLAAVVAGPEDGLLAPLQAACGAQLMHDEGTAAYHFVHDVIREVVEADLGTARRVALHRRVAEALEHDPSMAGRADEVPIERLAYHFSQGESWERALEYLVKAGDRAAAVYANQDALVYYAQALTVCDRLGDAALPTEVAVAQKRGDLHVHIQHLREARDDYDRVAVAARRLGDRRLEGLALADRGRVEEEGHAFETAEETLRAALALGVAGYDEVRLAAGTGLAHCLAIVGRKAEAEAVLWDVGDLAQQDGDPAPRQAWYGMAALLHTWDGRFDDALATSEHSSPPGGPASPAEIVDNGWGLALILGGRGEYTRALAILHEVITIAERIGEVWSWRRALNTLGWLYGELQDHQRALEWNTRGVQAVREGDVPETTLECENNARLNLADSLVALGRLEEAEAQYRAVEQVVRQPRPQDRYMLWRYAQHLFHSYGELWLRRGDATTALTYADECLALAEPTGSRKNIVKGRRLRGQALLAQGRPAEAEVDLTAALQVARQLDIPAQLWQTLVAWADLCRAQGRAQGAWEAYHAALDVIDRVAASLEDTELRETFLSSAHVRHVRQLAGEG